MNTKHKIILLLLASGLSIASCKKEQTSEENKSKITTASLARATNATFEPNHHEIREIVTGVDETDTRLRHIRLHLSVGLMEALKEPEVARWIFEKTKEAEDQEIKFLDLFEAFPHTKAIVEAAEDPLGQYTGMGFEELENELDYMGYQYWASIFLTNITSAKGEYDPVVTPGLDIEDLDGISDIAFAWQRDEDGGLKQIRVWEELANSTTAPVIAVSMMTKNTYQKNDTPPDIAKKDTPNDFIDDKAEITSVRIYHRYDASKSSEYCITGYWTSKNLGSGRYLRGSCLGGLINGGINDEQHYTKLLDIHKKKLGSDINPNRFFCQLRTSGEMDYNKLVYFNTFERDWFAGVKNLGIANFSGYPYLNLKGRMSQAHEWYQYNPDKFYVNTYVDVWGIWFAGLGNSVTYPAEQSKGYVKFTRLHPCN